MIDASGSEFLPESHESQNLEGLIRRLTSASQAEGNGPMAPFRALVEQLAESLDRTRSTVRMLRDATDQLIESGRPPSFQVLQELGECSRRFGTLRNELRIVAHEQGQALPGLESLHDLSAIAGYLDTLLHSTPEEAPAPRETPADVWPMEHLPHPEVEARTPGPTLVEEPPAPAPVEEPLSLTQPEPVADQEPVVPEPEPPPEPAPTSSPTPPDPSRVQAIEVLTQVVRLQTVDGKRDFAPLEHCREHARSLLAALDSNPHEVHSDEARALASGDHPYCSLLTVALGTAPMDDGEWARHHARISGELGRELAIAAARARLRLAD